MFRVKRNTFPRHPGIAAPEPGDLVVWKRDPGCFRLFKADDDNFKMCLWCSPPVNSQGLKLNGQPPTLVGIVAQNKSKGYVFELEQVGDLTCPA